MQQGNTTYDVCVVGGGTTGVLAAVSAARLGARTAIVEAQGLFGGTATSGLVCIWHSTLDTAFEKPIIAGLTNEYAESPIFLRNGKPTLVPTMDEVEEIEFPPPVGRLEAFTTGGGVSTMPWTFQGKLKTLQNKTVRYPGHFAQLRAYYDLGLWRTDSVRVNSQGVIPRELFHALFEPMVTYPDDKDVVVIRIRATGRKDGLPAEVVVDLVDLYDEETGFTAMERTTGWDAAIVAAMMARSQTSRGSVPVEVAVPPGLFVQELARRGIEVKVREVHST